VRSLRQFSVEHVWVLTVLSLVVAVVALGVALAARRRHPSYAGDPDALPEDVVGLRQEVAALRSEAAGSFRHLGIVRYDAFSDVGGRLSWSVALLDDSGSGVVMTAIHGRSEARSYAKALSGWACDQPLSPEEGRAVTSAKP
jgi:Protein of unknown function (DUF4446)